VFNNLILEILYICIYIKNQLL